MRGDKIFGGILFLMHGLLSVAAFTQNCEPTLFYFPGDNIRGDYHVDLTPDGNYLLAGLVDNAAAGSEDDIRIIKSDIFGNELWSATLVWPGDESVSAVRVLPDGSAVLVGSTDSETLTSAERGILLVKIDAQGGLVWWRTYGTAAGTEYTGTDVEVMANGGFVISGTVEQEFNDQAMVFLTTDPNGQQTQWTTKSLYVDDVLHGSGGDFGRSSAFNVTILGNGDFLFTGITYPQSFVFPTGAFLSVVRTTPALTTVWETADAFSTCLVDEGWDAEESGDGTLLIAARYEVDVCFDAFGGTRMHTMTADGNLLESYLLGTYGGSNLLPTEDGNFIIGRRNGIVKIDRYGQVLWESPAVAGFACGSGNSLVPSPNGGYLLAGRKQNAAVMVEFDAFGNSCITSLAGVVYLDEDENCERADTEPIVPSLLVELNDGEQFTNTNPEGWFYMQSDTGSHQVRLHPPNALWSVACPPTTTYDEYLSDVYGHRPNLNFGLRPNEACALLNVEVTLPWARACTTQEVIVRYENAGTVTVEDVYVELAFTEQLDFLDADLPWELDNGLYRVNIGSLTALQSGSFRVRVAVACDAEIDSEACVTATIFPTTVCSSAMGHPVEQHCRTVRNSYDPNDKLVVAADTFSCWKTALDKLEYTIRFQNTGNDTAFQVVIIDTLPDILDMRTVRPGPSSHDYTLRVLSDRRLMFSFKDINLLDSLSDAAASQGFVQFSVHARPTIADGTVITNRAAIYFDHNPPIITPEVSIGQCVAVPLVIVEVETEQVTDCATPNGKINIIAAGGEGGYEYSIDGGLNWGDEAEFTDLAAGDYEVFLRDGEGETYAFPQNPVTVTEFLPIVLDLSANDPSSCGGEEGYIRVEAIAPGSLTYSIDGGETYSDDHQFFSLPQGDYTVIVLNECAVGDTLNVTLSDPTPPEILSVDWQDPDCDGTGGNIQIEAEGVRSLRYSIDNGATWRTGSTFNFLEPGVYQVVVSYGAGNCEVIYENTIELVAGGLMPEIVTTQLDLSNVCTGGGIMLTIGATGGEELVYSIDGGVTFQPSSQFIGLETGFYDLVVRNECDLTDTLAAFEIPALPAPAILNVLTTDPGCGQINGSVEIVGGTGYDLTYSIDDWAGSQTSSLFENLPAGTYTVSVRDAYDCEMTPFSVELMEAGAPVITQIEWTDAGCTPAVPGVIEIFASSTESMQYSIDGGATWSEERLFTEVSPGLYDIRVANATLTCVATDPNNLVTIITQAFPEIIDIEVHHPSEMTAADGSITVTATGDGFLLFSIDEGENWQEDHVFTGLPVGNYTVFVRSGAEDCIVGQTDIVLDAAVSTQETGTEPLLRVYPNPADDLVNIEWKLFTTETVRWSVVNLLGETVAALPAQRLATDKFTLDVSDWPAGVYYLRCSIAREWYRRAIVVE